MDLSFYQDRRLKTDSEVDQDDGDGNGSIVVSR